MPVGKALRLRNLRQAEVKNMLLYGFS